MKTCTLIVALVLSLMVFTQCSKPPVVETEKAQTAIEAAKNAQAQMYAPEAFAAALDTLNAALAEKERSASKFFLFRSYGKAEDLFVQAESLASQAAQKAISEKEILKNEVQNLIEETKAILDSAQTALVSAPTGKGSKADIALLKNDLATASKAYEEVLLDFRAERFTVARSKLMAIIQQARNVTQQIEQARSRKGM